MKALYYTITCLLLFTAHGRVFSQTPYTVDVNASSIKWTGHAQAGGYAPQGTLKIKSGTITLTNGRLSAGKILVDMVSLHQDNSEMQEHLRGTDFFDVTRYPDAIMTLRSVTDNSVMADLTIKGVTKPIKFTVDLKDDGAQVTIHGELQIDRTQYGIKYNSASYFQDLGSYAIKNEFEVDVSLVARKR